MVISKLMVFFKFLLKSCPLPGACSKIPFYPFFPGIPFSDLLFLPPPLKTYNVLAIGLNKWIFGQKCPFLLQMIMLNLFISEKIERKEIC